MDITQRQQKLLLAIIREFIESADAVASMQLAAKYNLPISSATIRNEMKALCEAGYLRQLHTSSGRIPTTTGIRFYLNQILDQIDELSPLEQVRIKQQLFDQRFSKADLIKEALRTLVKLGNNPAFMLLDGEIHYAGLAEMLNIPEFQQLESLRRVLAILEDYSTLSRILQRNKTDNKVKILIGEELGSAELSDYAIVFSAVRLHGDNKGYVAVMGPNRMNYQVVVPAVQYITEVIAQAVRGW